MPDKAVADVSVIVANYNNGNYLDTFINSVERSTMLPAELIIVDDGSTDHSLSVLDKWSNLPFLRVIRFEKNRGLTAALNAALEAATGKYIMRADPDDILLPVRIATQYAYMEKHREVDVLGSNVIYFKDVATSSLNRSNFPLQHHEIEARFRKGEHGLQHPTAFVRGHVYKQYRYQKIFPAEDYEIFSRMVKDGRIFANIHEPLYLMRVHAGSSTSNLKYSAIQQTFDFRDQIFNTRTSKLRTWLYYLHILHYRKSQLADNQFSRHLHLAVATILYPMKLLRRI